MEQKEKILEVINLRQYFKLASMTKERYLRAVDGVSFEVFKGETLGLVGESGSGKTTVGRTLLNLNRATGGEIFYMGRKIISDKDFAYLRKHVAMVFQDPYSSLNPRMTVMDIIAEPLDVKGLYESKEDRKQKVLSLMTEVGLNPEHAKRYAHEFSGGQRQRIGIARALALSPEFIICDEPVSALDVSVQAQVINTFIDLKEKRALTMLFIAHDLPVVRHISDRIAVMYLGRIVELGEAGAVMDTPMHPYTELLVSSIPSADYKKKDKDETVEATSEKTSPIGSNNGCPFRFRCPHARELCADSLPELTEISEGRFSACHRAKDIYGL